MQRKDIKAGELLAYRRSNDDTWTKATPCIVLDTESLWTETWKRMRGTYEYTRASGWKCSSDNMFFGECRETGFLVAMGQCHSFSESDQAANISALRAFVAPLPGKLEPDVLNAIAHGDIKKPEGIRIDVVNNRALRGTWQDVKAAQDANKAARQRADEQRRALGHWRQDAFAVLTDAACRSAGTTAVVIRNEPHGRVSMELETLARVLGVELPEKEV